MMRHRNPYPAEFRAQLVELVRAGRKPEELAREFEPTAQSIHNWVAQADRDAGRRHDGLTSSEREELTRLRRENRQLKLEREILAKAAAWSARVKLVVASVMRPMAVYRRSQNASGRWNRVRGSGSLHR